MKIIMTMIICVIWVQQTFAAPITWNGGGAGDWTDNANWEGNIAPSAGDTAVIPSGKTATLATSADFVLANSLVGISLSADDSVLAITNVSQQMLSAPVTGLGRFVVANGQQTLNLNCDNSGFTGPFLFTNSHVVVNNAKALGTVNVVTNYAVATASTKLEIMASGNFGNEFHVFGDMTAKTVSAREAYYCARNFVTNTGPFHVYGAAAIIGPSGDPDSGFVTFSGDFHHEGEHYAHIRGKARIIGNMPCSIRTTSQNLRGGILVYSNAELEFGAPIKKESSVFEADCPFARIAAYDSVLRFISSVQFPDNNQGALGFGSSSFSDTKGGTIDLNGFSQTVCDIVKDPQTETTPMILTSATPATLTVKGTYYRFSFANWKGDQSKVANIQLEGNVSYELDSRQSTLSGRWQFGDGHTYFTNVTSTTKGFLSVARGTMRLGANTSWPNLSELRARNQGKLLVDTAAVNPGRFLFSVSGSATVTIADGVLLNAKKAVIGGTYLEPGVYGGPDAGLDAAHTLSCLNGTGRLNVRQPENSGFIISFR